MIIEIFKQWYSDGDEGQGPIEIELLPTKHAYELPTNYGQKKIQ